MFVLMIESMHNLFLSLSNFRKSVLCSRLINHSRAMISMYLYTHRSEAKSQTALQYVGETVQPSCSCLSTMRPYARATVHTQLSLYGQAWRKHGNPYAYVEVGKSFLSSIVQLPDVTRHHPAISTCVRIHIRFRYKAIDRRLVASSLHRYWAV